MASNIDEREAFDLPSWRFRIANLGCVESGELEVKPLTLLCGPNNTGKTWVMYALYGFFRYPMFVKVLKTPDLAEVAYQLKTTGICEWNFDVWFKENIKYLIKISNEGLVDGLVDIFGVSDGFFGNSQMEWLVEEDEFLGYIKNNILNINNSGDYLEIVDAENIRIKAHEIMKDLSRTAKDDDGMLLFSLSIWGILGWRKRPKAFLMPAERSGLHLIFRELRNRRTSILHPSNRAFLDVDELSSYTQPIADYIDWLNRLDTSCKELSKLFQGFSSHVAKLVGGWYEVDAEGNIGFIPERVCEGSVDARKLDFHITSSTVKSLFPLWFYLEHQAKPGDVLMIDEPELNLHPANQRAVARLLARLVNAGIRVVCSTHSDYIVREINSLIMLARPHPQRAALMQRFGYEEEEILRPEQVGAYVFENGHIAAMPITEDEGISAQTFDQQIHELNETSDEIYYTYRDNGGEAAGG